MIAESQRPKGRENAVSLLSEAIDAMDPAEKISSITLAKAAFGAVNILLVMIKPCFLLFRDAMPQVHA